MEKKNNIKIKANDLMGRGEFLKRLGGGAAVTAAALAGCDKSAVSTSETLGEVPTDKMTYRVNKEKGDRVSILGYGCMRWPTRKRDDGEGEEIDQETVNGLVDYAISHGVNYFDTSPVEGYGHSPEPPSAQFVLLGDETVKLLEPYARKFDADVPPFVRGAADRLHRLLSAALDRRQHGGV